MSLAFSLSLDSGGSWLYSVVLTPPNSTISHNPAGVNTSGAHSSAFSCLTNRKIFLWCLLSLELKEFPRRFETHSNLGFSDPVCNLKYAYFNIGLVRYLASFFWWCTVSTWGHHLWPAKQHYILIATLLRTIDDGIIASSNSRHFIRLERSMFINTLRLMWQVTSIRFMQIPYFLKALYLFRKSEEKK